MALLLSNFFIVILMIYFGWRCHTSCEPTRFKFTGYVCAYVSQTVTLSFVSRTICCYCCYYSSHTPSPNDCKPRGRRWHAIINNTALTYNQLHIDQQHIINLFLFFFSFTVSTLTEQVERKRKKIKSLFRAAAAIIIIMMDFFFCCKQFGLRFLFVSPVSFRSVWRDPGNHRHRSENFAINLCNMIHSQLKLIHMDKANPFTGFRLECWLCH